MPTRHPTPPRLAFLIGGSEGIGLATARALAARGTSVVLFGRSPAKLEAALSSLGTAGARHAAHALDVRDRAGTEAVLGEALALHGIPQLVLVTAGFARAAWFGEDEVGLAEDIIAVNLLGSMNVARALLPALRTAGTGRLILTSSLAGLVAVPGYTAYSAANFGLIGFADALRREVHREGIRVSVLCPPNTRTPGFAEENRDKPAKVLASEEKVKTLSAEDVAAALLRALPRSPRLIVPGADSRLAALAVRLFPAVGDLALRRR